MGYSGLEEGLLLLFRVERVKTWQGPNSMQALSARLSVLSIKNKHIGPHALLFIFWTCSCVVFYVLLKKNSMAQHCQRFDVCRPSIQVLAVLEPRTKPISSHASLCMFPDFSYAEIHVQLRIASIDQEGRRCDICMSPKRNSAFLALGTYHVGPYAFLYIFFAQL